MMSGAPLPIASLATTLVGAALLIAAVLTVAVIVYYFRRARSREALAPSQAAESVQAVSEMRALGDRIETLVSQQQLQGETQRQRLGQQIDEVRQVVGQQGHRVDGLRGELHHEMQKRDHEIEEIRQQLTAIQRSAALPATETHALPAPAPQPRALPPAPLPTATEAGGDSFAGADALPPAAPELAAQEPDAPEPAAPAPTPHDPFDDALFSEAAPSATGGFFGQTPEPLSTPSAAEPIEASAPEPVAPTSSAPEPAAAEPSPAEVFAPDPIAAQPETFTTAAPEPDVPEADPHEASAPAYESSVFSDMGFDAFAPGEAAPLAEPASWDVAPAPVPVYDAEPATLPPAAPQPATPSSAGLPDGGAWVAAQRETPAVPVFTPDEWAAPAPTDAAPEAPAPYTPPADADDFLFISMVTEDVQRALYIAGVTKLEEIAHWSRGDARRISAEVGVSEETIMNQWVFEAQGALFERYSSHVGG